MIQIYYRGLNRAKNTAWRMADPELEFDRKKAVKFQSGKIALITSAGGKVN